LGVIVASIWREGPRFDTMLVGIILMAATLVGIWQIRGGIFAAGLATVPLAAWIATWRRDGADASLSSQLTMLAAWLLSINLTWGALADGLSTMARESEQASAKPAENSCATKRDFALLDTFPAATVLSGVNQGAPILAFTHHRVVAAPYHRNVGNIVAYEAFSSDPATAQAVLAGSGITLVAVCRSADESPDLPSQSLHAHLMRGEAPAWLHLVPASKGQTIEIYQVEQPAG